MRKALLIALLLVLLVPVVSSAAGPAAVIRNFGCVLTDNASGLGTTLYTTNKTQEVLSASGQVRLTCHFRIPPGYRPARNAHYDGFLCATNYGLTTNSRSVISRDSTAHLVCIIKK